MAIKNFKTKKTTLNKVFKKISKSKSSYKKTKKSMRGGKFKSIGSWKSMSGGSSCNSTRKFKFNKNKFNSKSKFNSKTKKHLKQKGGFLNNTNCNLATIKEPGFHLDGSGSIDGISIPETRAVIYNPNCKPDTYQAMTP